MIEEPKSGMRFNSFEELITYYKIEELEKYFY